MDRRDFLKASAMLGVSSVIQPAMADPILQGLNESDLIYLSPIKSNGRESSCQAEIWFVYDGASCYVVTRTGSWRATAPSKGLTSTRIWVGDLGEWTGPNGKHVELPTYVAKASIEPDKAEQERVLELFGDKYSMSWLVWGPRFRKGLTDGSRTMLKYQRMS